MDNQKCIVPCRVYEHLKWPKIKGVYVWVLYDRKPPYLPVAVADTSTELAEIAGVLPKTVIDKWQGYKHGRNKHSKYHRVKIGARICG